MSNHFKGSGDKTVIKLQILEKYLEVYTTILEKRWLWGDLWYVDTHSGSGKAWLDRYGVEVDGSAIRAIENHRDNFDRFYFYEKSSDKFDLLVRTLEDRFDISFFRSEPSDDRPFFMAGCDSPRIRIFQTDCNKGVPRLAKRASKSNHWFVFIDPAKVTHLEEETTKAVVTRGKTDILITLLTSGVHRAGSADHAKDSVARMSGEGYHADSLDGAVQWYRDTIEKAGEYKTVSRETRSEHDKRVRFDLVFASANCDAIRIMKDIFTNPNLKNGITSEISEVRKSHGQQGLGSYDVTFIDPDDDSSQTGLSDF